MSAPVVALRKLAVELYAVDKNAASLALLLSDALDFSEVPENMEPLLDGLTILLTSEVTDEQERDIFQRLLAAGWQATAPSARLPVVSSNERNP